MHPKCNSTSFTPGMKRSEESIRKQSATIKERIALGQWHKANRKIGGKPDNIPERECINCESLYKPTSARQKWCVHCVPDKSARRILSRYKITPAELHDLLVSQNHTCAICDKAPQVIDHDHKTGKVRGLLCQGCNIKMAALDDIAWLAKASQYVSI